VAPHGHPLRPEWYGTGRRGRDVRGSRRCPTLSGVLGGIGSSIGGGIGDLADGLGHAIQTVTDGFSHLADGLVRTVLSAGPIGLGLIAVVLLGGLVLVARR